MADKDIEKYKRRNEKKQLKRPKAEKDWTGLNDPRPPKTRPNYMKYIKNMKKEEKISMPKDELVDEHKKLVDVLESESHTDDRAEAKKQKKELKEYMNKTEDKYHIHENGVSITSKPLTLKQIDKTHGGVKKLESNGFKVIQHKPAMVKEDLRIDEEADGKKELDYGKEELDKEDQDAAASANYTAQQEYERDVKKRWKKLKKAMADDAFVDIEEASASEEGPEEEQETSPEEAPESDGQDPQTDEDMSDDEMHEMLSGLEGGDEEAESDDQEGPAENDDTEDLDEDGTADADEESLEDLMGQLGYSEQEIAHTVHGHHFPDVDELQQAKTESENTKREGELTLRQLEAEIKQMEGALKNGHAERINQYDADHKKQLLELERDHTGRMKDLEYATAMRDHESSDDTEHKKNLRGVELERAQKDIPGDKFDDTEHQKRMMDLEYEKAQREMELDLDIKKQQSEHKMKQMEVDAKVRSQEKAVAAKDKAKQKKTESKEKVK